MPDKQININVEIHQIHRVISTSRHTRYTE